MKRLIPSREPEVRMAYHLKQKYGLTLAAYRAMEEGQKGLCAMCGKPPTGGHKKLYVDHDHKTGKIRGLLCSSCNCGLGWIELHSEEAKVYLRR
jgi:hypothetical protein